MMRPATLWLWMFVLPSCSGGAPASPAAPSPAEPARAAAPPDAASRAAPPPTPTAPAAPAGPVDLLHATPAALAVSSASSSIHHPADLVDGRLETSWNSVQGDQRGAWIAFRIPADARVSALRITPGMLSQEDGRDAFPANPRIKRLRILRDGVPVGERDLDPDSRTLQELPLEGPGGEYRIEVLEVVPGTNPRWRQVCVSELQVWGTPGATVRAEPAAPTARVGSFAGAPAHDGVVAPRQSAAGMTARNAPLTRPLELARLLQGEWLVAVQPVLVRELRGDGPGRVLVALYAQSDAQEAYATRRRARRRSPDGHIPGCLDATGRCPNLWLARASIAPGAAPVVDAVMRFATDMCGASAYEAVSGGGSVLARNNFDGDLDLRDVDGDGRLEAIATVRWEDTPVCPIGTTAHESVVVMDVETSRVELELDLLLRDGSMVGPHTRQRFFERDLNGDGHVDLDVQAATYLASCGLDARGWPLPTTPLVVAGAELLPEGDSLGDDRPWERCAAQIDRRQLLYDPATDHFGPLPGPAPGR